MLLNTVYLLNVIVTAWISFTCLFAPQKAKTIIFENAFEYSEAYRLIGCLWFAIFVISILGLWYPESMALILLFQFIYKSTWLLQSLISKSGQNKKPISMNTFFVIWVVFLPFVIPWKNLF